MSPGDIAPNAAAEFIPLGFEIVLRGLHFLQGHLGPRELRESL